MKILNIYLRSIEKLKRINIKNPQIDVKILLAHVLHIDSSMLFMFFDKTLSTIELKKFNQLLKKRINREPIANIIKKKGFWNLNFYVNKNVLTPRSESETLINSVLKYYTNKSQKLKILDLGCGSGCLILTLLDIYKESFGTATDINKKSIYVAKKNADILNINNIIFKNCNWNDKINDKFDIIISNPPYIKTKDIKKLEPEVNKYNPLISLDGGIDGLKHYRYIASNIDKNLKEGAKIFLEIGKNQEDKIIEIFNKNNFEIIEISKDLLQINRILIFRKKL